MSEMVWPRDEFHEDTFGGPIDDASIYALSRLRQLRSGQTCEYELGDVQYEQYVGQEFGHVQTRLYTFASVFESLHAAIMRSDIMSDYLHTIVARLVATGVKEQSSSAGNLITQLPPDKDALNVHATEVWAAKAPQRQEGRPFDVYRFYVGQDIASVVFSPECDDTWAVGYEMSLNRVLMTTQQSVGSAWRPNHAIIED